MTVELAHRSSHTALTVLSLCLSVCVRVSLSAYVVYLPCATFARRRVDNLSELCQHGFHILHFFLRPSYHIRYADHDIRDC